MRKFKLFLLALTGAAILMLGGCKEKQTYDEAAFENDMEPLTDDELKAMDEDSDDEMTAMDEGDGAGAGFFRERQHRKYRSRCRKQNG